VAFALSAAALVQWHRAEGIARVTIASGITEGRDSEGIRKFVQVAVPYRLALTQVESLTTFEAIKRVDAGTLDLAVIQGGIDFSGYPNIRQVTAIQVLPLQFLVKDELAEDVTTHLGALRGKQVALGSTDSVTYRLAREVLAFAGLRGGAGGQPGDYREASLDPRELAAESDRDRLPDALFVVAPLPNPLIRQLVQQQGYRLIPLDFRDAFALTAINESVSQPGHRPGTKDGPRREILREHIVDTVIPAFTYQADPGVPPRPLHTFGMNALMIANRHVAPDVVGRILHALFETRYAKLVQPRLDIRRLEEIPEVPWHAGASAYLARSKPVFTGEFLSQVVNVTSIAGPVLGGLVFLRQWLRQRSHSRREQSFEAYIARVSQLERSALELERSGTLEQADLLRLRRELGKLKDEALTRFVRGEMAGEARMTSFLAHINDTRCYLAHLIEHASCGPRGSEP
jgi:TRAP-type uncharacterized transport system substrate-binding protein